MVIYKCSNYSTTKSNIVYFFGIWPMIEYCTWKKCLWTNSLLWLWSVNNFLKVIRYKPHQCFYDACTLSVSTDFRAAKIGNFWLIKELMSIDAKKSMWWVKFQKSMKSWRWFVNSLSGHICSPHHYFLYFH